MINDSFRLRVIDKHKFNIKNKFVRDKWVGVMR